MTVAQPDRLGDVIDAGEVRYQDAEGDLRRAALGLRACQARLL